ncbi:MAG: 3-methyl-2-oxobutanoate hydroxymethyltransferase [Myxococcales bacterium]|nr:MAG: 3-methyl-2-oxobutanoate hydroxymethyltransferase [Myxococcales bacterium]
MERKRIELATLLQKKAKGEKITMLTAYDAPTARALDDAGIDTLLVGDSAGNVVLGYRDTRPVTMDEMIVLTSAVARGTRWAYVIGDMPFMSYNATRAEAIRNAGRFVKEAGAEAVKLEGGGPMAGTLQAIVQAGIPVVGHLGLTPQTVGMLGGYRVQGKSAENAARIVRDALELESAGACMLVLEMVPDRVAALISRRLKIPTIGIGSGPDCDGQVLVVHDMLGVRAGFTPKFVKRYAALGEEMERAAAEYKADVESLAFPAAAHSFAIDDAEYARLESLVKDL